MPARNRSNSAAAANRSGNDAPPYFKVMDPLEGGYGYGKEIQARDGNAFDEFEINIYDDRTDRGQRRPAIQVQVRKTGKFGSTTVLTLDDLSAFEELVDDLASALEVMKQADAAAAQPKPARRRKPTRA